jgi:enterochelin esterase-like enzyme
MSRPITRRAALAGGLATTATLSGPFDHALAAAAPARVPARQRGTVVTGAAPSPALGEEIAFRAYLPAGYGRGSLTHPVVYLLHGRGDSMDAWTRIADELDRMIAERQVPPLIAVMPDAQWSDGGSYYVDSAYTGSPTGRPVETALTVDLVAHVDRTYRTRRGRADRFVGGYSMGGYGALRWVLAHQDLFAGALVLSPAVYTPLPPLDSSTREFGAFGSGATRFVDETYVALNYPALLDDLDPTLPIRIWLAVGDDEWPNPLPEDYRHDLDFETAVVYNAVKRSAAVRSELRVLDGGHDWDVWVPAFVAGLPFTVRGET